MAFVSRTSNQKQARALERHLRIQQLEARVEVLENALRDVWIWQATDGLDLDTLRKTLATADRDARLIAALDGLVKTT